MGGVCIPIKVDLLLAKLEGRQIDEHNHSTTWCSRKVDCMAKSRFYQPKQKKKNRLLWNLNMKKHSDLAFKFRKHDFTRCFMRKQWTIF